MKKRNRTLLSLLLALSLMAALALPAAAAAGPRVLYQKQSGHALLLAMDGLGEGSVYAAQLELTLDGRFSSARFSPDSRVGYSPECRVTAAGESTQITIYLTAQKPLNRSRTLPLGVLELDQDFSVPASVTVTLLDRQLQPFSDVDHLAVSPVQGTLPPEPSSSSEDNDSEEDDPLPGNQVRILSAEHGAVHASAGRAQAGDTVTLTVEPQQGYHLGRLNVTSVGGREVALYVGEDRFTFQMPDAQVEVRATFLPIGSQPEAPVFSDVAETDWHYRYVRYVAERAMMSGTSSTTFAPDMTASRGMLVTVLYRMEGTPTMGAPSFPDVLPDQYYTGAVAWASANKVVSGYQSGMFGPDDNITRQQLAAVLYRYAAYKGYNTTARGDLSVFADRDAIYPYAVDAMSWAVGSGLISGMGDGTISPAAPATRAQVAAILMRFCENIVHQ